MGKSTSGYFLILLFSFFFISCINTKKLDVVYVYKKQIIYEGKTDGNGSSTILRDSITAPLIIKIIKKDSFIAVTKYEGEYVSDTVKINVTVPVYNGLFFPYYDTTVTGKSTFVGSKK